MERYYIFDIPIYRCTEERVYSDVDAAVANENHKLFLTTGILQENAPVTCRRVKQHIIEECGGPWNFNQVVGWLRLFAEWSHIGGHLWWVDVKHIQRNMRNKRFL